jgi:hypothetical protein
VCDHGEVCTGRILCVMADEDMALALRAVTGNVVHIQSLGCAVDRIVGVMSEELYSVELNKEEIDQLFQEVLAGLCFTAVVCGPDGPPPIGEQLSVLAGVPVRTVAALAAEDSAGVTQ